MATKGQLKYLRTYPLGAAFAPVTGYRPVNLAATGIEHAEDDYLAGNSDAQALDRFWDLFSDTKKPGGNVFLTINKSVQQTAYDDLVAQRDRRQGGRGGRDRPVHRQDPRAGVVPEL